MSSPQTAREALITYYAPAVCIPFTEAARVIGISRSTAYRMAAEGDLPFETRKIGGRHVVRLDDLLDYLYPDQVPGRSTRGRPRRDMRAYAPR